MSAFYFTSLSSPYLIIPRMPYCWRIYEQIFSLYFQMNLRFIIIQQIRSNTCYTAGVHQKVRRIYALCFSHLLNSFKSAPEIFHFFGYLSFHIKCVRMWLRITYVHCVAYLRFCFKMCLPFKVKNMVNVGVFLF